MKNKSRLSAFSDLFPLYLILTALWAILFMYSLLQRNLFFIPLEEYVYRIGTVRHVNYCVFYCTATTASGITERIWPLQYNVFELFLICVLILRLCSRKKQKKDTGFWLTPARVRRHLIVPAAILVLYLVLRIWESYAVVDVINANLSRGKDFFVGNTAFHIKIQFYSLAPVILTSWSSILAVVSAGVYLILSMTGMLCTMYLPSEPETQPADPE